MKLKDGQTLFRDESVFDPGYVPEDYLFRESQIRQITTALRPALRGAKAGNLFIFGRPATGKTTAVKLVLAEMQKEMGRAVAVHVNCHIYNSEYRILGEIHKKIFGFVPPETGIPVTALYDKIFSRMEKDRKNLVICLDDMNFYDAKLANSILYDFLRVYEIFKINTAIWCISVKNELHKLDDKVRSVFVANTLEFQQYGKEEMKEILKRRAITGLHDNVMADSTLDKIAGESSDLRYGLELIKRSAQIAEDELSARIMEKHVDQALKGFEQPLSSGVEDSGKMLINLLRKGSRESGELYEEYGKITGASYSTFYRIILKLKEKGIIDTEQIGKEKGRSSKIKLK